LAEADLLWYFTGAVTSSPDSDYEFLERNEHHAIERDEMTPERYQQIGRLFDAALEQAPAERVAWLERASGDDAELRAEVEKLLAHHPESDEFLARPAMNVAADLLAQNQPTPTDVAGQQIGHYQILSLLGAGGMGQVYLAKDLKLGRQVALKLLPAHFLQSAEHVRRFEREAWAASALNHPNILTIYEFGTVATDAGETHFLATELVQGENLRQRLARGSMTIAEVLDITTQIVAALHAAHDAGIIHRDIKPDNVMMRRDGLVKVLDFGLAKLTEGHGDVTIVGHSNLSVASLTHPGTILGTVAYMSPEQARGNEVDTRTDLFSLGVVLYEMLTGHRPFTGETVNHIIVAILEQEPPPLAEPTVPAELERILKRMLAKKVEARYASAAALLSDLKQLTKRLEREEELALVAPAAHEAEAATAIIHRQTNEQLGEVTRQLPANDSARQAAVTEVAPALVTRPARRKSLWLLSALLAAGLISVPVWQVWRSRAVPSPAPTAGGLERQLSYFLTVQKYRDGKPYQSEFQSSGREIFEAGWRFKLNVTAAQDGFLYLLNEEASGVYVLLFPLPSHNNGAARLAANERLQTNWYVFDDKPGTEQFRLIWAAQPVPELEALRALVNPTAKGRVSDPTQLQAVQTFLQQHSTSPIESLRDAPNKQTQVRGMGAVLIALVELEHH
jgi:serine/threonine protein kinase